MELMLGCRRLIGLMELPRVSWSFKSSAIAKTVVLAVYSRWQLALNRWQFVLSSGGIWAAWTFFLGVVLAAV